MAGMMQQQFTQMVDQLQKSVREVHLTVSWKEGKLTESFDVVTHVVTMGPGSDRNGGDAASQAAAAAAGGAQWVRADNGQPVPNPRPGPNGTFVDPNDGSPLRQVGGAPGLPGGVAPTMQTGMGTILQNVGGLQPRTGSFR